MAYLTSSRNFYQHGSELGAIWDPTWSDFGAQLGFNLTGFPPTCNRPSTSALPSSQSLLLYSLIYLVAVLVDVPRPLTRDDTTTSTWCDNHGGLSVHNFVHWSLHPRPLCFRCTLATFGHEYDIDAPDATSMMAAPDVTQPVKH